jgi:hypothetical protein
LRKLGVAADKRSLGVIVAELAQQPWLVGQRMHKRSYRHLQIGVAVLVSLLTASAQAFEADGFASDMSRAQIEVAARHRGLEAWNTDFDNLVIGNRPNMRIDGVFAFCDDKMRWYNRPLDFDSDYYAAMESFLGNFGQPSSTTVGQQPWNGPGGGYVQSVSTVWKSEKDRITLSFSPEGRDGKGALIHNRAASVSYVAATRCTSSNWSFESRSPMAAAQFRR